MRNHGWQLPYHPLQVVAIAVFLALAVAFYVFFMPFVGNRILEFLVIALYSPMVIAVFGLYIWCAATNPADDGVFRSKKYLNAFGHKKKPPTLGASSTMVIGANAGDAELSVERQLHLKTRKTDGVHIRDSHMKPKSSCSTGRLLMTALFCNLCRHKPTTDQFTPADDLLYCSLCEVEIFKHSKHCRVCDKCVDGFDHHCRWLNNCIGRKNYKGFVALMISGISMLMLQWTVGIWVVVHCFLDRQRFQDDIISKLGSSFSLVSFVIVVAFCTVLAMVATLPLGQLFFFHILLIKKGMSTYDYIVAMREQEHQSGVGEGAQSPLTSPASSVATAISGGSSAGALQRGTWCTPPRLFRDSEQAVLQPGSTSFVRDMELGNARASANDLTKKKPAVKINPLALARLNREDVVRATSQARNNSSILRPVMHHEGTVVAETDSSLDNSSRDVSTEIFPPPASKTTSRKLDDVFSPIKDKFSLARSWRHRKFSLESPELVDCSGNDAVNVNQRKEGRSAVPTPLQLEARGAFHMSEAFVSVLSGSSPESSIASSDAQTSGECHVGTRDITPHVSVVPVDGPLLHRSASDGYEASGGESADDSDQARNSHHSWSKLRLHPYYSHRNEITHSAELRIAGVGGMHASEINPFSRKVKLSNANLSKQESAIDRVQEHPFSLGL